MRRVGVDGAASRRRRGGMLAAGLLRIACLAAGSAVLARFGGIDGYWLCVPLALLASAGSSTGAGRLAGPGAVVLAAIIAAPGSDRGLPPLWVAVIVPAVSVAVLTELRRRLERERDSIRRLSLTDPLTGVANRRLLISRAAYEIARHTRIEREFALVMIDLDHFKAVNDRLGHPVGDELLRDVAAALTQTLRAQDTIARIGGDEFCVIAPETDRVEELATRIRDAVSDASGRFGELRASVGVAVFPDDGHRVEELLAVADERLLAVKRARPPGDARRAA